MSRSEKKLLSQYQALPEQAQQSLLDFCNFLSHQYQGERLPDSVTVAEQAQPKDIPRPKDESVVLAMRRLSDTYFMLNKDDLLHKASALMSQHILQGRDAVEVIDDLEVLFLESYNQLVEQQTPGAE